MQTDPIDTAAKALRKHYPDAVGGFVAGSILRGDETETSDIDIAVLYAEPFDRVHRFSTTVDDWPVEFFVHNVQAQDYYFEKDRRRGMCVMPTIVGTGVMIPGESELLRSQQQKARKVIEAGPPALSSEEIELRRYMLTDQVDDLKGARSTGERNAILVQLHDLLGDFFLRTRNNWSGTGKAMIRLLNDADSSFAAEFVGKFEDCFSGGQIDPIIQIAAEVLQPHGGFLRDGYYSIAPDSWREN